MGGSGDETERKFFLSRSIERSWSPGREKHVSFLLSLIDARFVWTWDVGLRGGNQGRVPFRRLGRIRIRLEEIRERPSRNLTRRNLKPLPTDFKVLSWYIPRIFPSLPCPFHLSPLLSSPSPCPRLSTLFFSSPTLSRSNVSALFLLTKECSLSCSSNSNVVARATQYGFSFFSSSLVSLPVHFFPPLLFEILKHRRGPWTEVNKSIRIMQNVKRQKLIRELPTPLTLPTIPTTDATNLYSFHFSCYSLALSFRCATLGTKSTLLCL